MITVELQGWDTAIDRTQAVPAWLQETLVTKINQWLVDIQGRILAGLDSGDPLKSRTGAAGLAGSVQIQPASPGPQIQGSVESSGMGGGKAFPYGTMWESYGHGEIYPVTKKMLHFIASDGKEVFTKRVRAMPPLPWFYPPALAAVPDMKADILAAVLEGLGGA